MSDFGDELAGLRTPWWRFMLSQEMRTALDAKDAAQRVEASLSYVQGQTVAQSAQTERRVEQLEQQVAALALYARTILQVLVDKGLCDGQDFAIRLGEVDLLDGKADGR